MNEEENKENPPPSDDSPQQDQQLNKPSADETIVPFAETSTDAEQPITHNPPPVTE